MTLGTDWRIDDLLTFSVNTHDPTVTGSPEADADAVPGYRVYEDEIGTPILTGSMAKLDDANTLGFYSEQITLSAANGFEAGKCYTIRIRAVVTAISQSIAYHFRMMPTIAQPSAVLAATSTRDQILGWLGAMNRNKRTQTSTTTTLRNDADSGTIATSTVEDNSTTFTRGEWA